MINICPNCLRPNGNHSETCRLSPFTQKEIHDAEISTAEQRGYERGVREALVALDEAPATKSEDFSYALGYSEAFVVATWAVRVLLEKKS